MQVAKAVEMYLEHHRSNSKKLHLFKLPLCLGHSQNAMVKRK